MKYCSIDFIMKSVTALKNRHLRLSRDLSVQFYISFFYFGEATESYETKKSLSKSNHWIIRYHLMDFFKFPPILYSNLVPISRGSRLKKNKRSGHRIV